MLSRFNARRVRDLINLNVHHCIVSLFTGAFIIWMGITPSISFHESIDRFLVAIIGILYTLYTIYNIIKVIVVSYQVDKSIKKEIKNK